MHSQSDTKPEELRDEDCIISDSDHCSIDKNKLNFTSGSQSKLIQFEQNFVFRPSQRVNMQPSGTAAAAGGGAGSDPLNNMFSPRLFQKQ